MEHTPYQATDLLETLVQAKFYNKFLSQTILKHKPNCNDIIDFGAGIGTFADLLKQENQTVICIEHCQNNLSTLQEKGYESYKDIDVFQDNSLPYVYSLNVLEHIENDLGALQELYVKMAPGGTLLLYVPAFNILFSDLDVKVGHCRRYTRQYLEKVVQQAGFTVEKSSYVDSLGFLVTLLFKFISNNQKSINLTMVTIYDRLIFPVSLCLDYLFHKVFGKNVLMICRK